MITFDDKTTEALGYVREAEKIMAELGHTKYSLSGMCSAAMRHDLEKEVGKLLGKLVEARKEIENLNGIITAALNSANVSQLRAIEYQSQRDILVEALERFDVDWTLEEGEETTTYFTYEDQQILRDALVTAEGGSHE
jgi:hypothetical protein